MRTIWTLKLTERWGESKNDSKEEVDGSFKNATEILGNIKRVPFHFLTCRSGDNGSLNVPFCLLVRTRKRHTTEIREVHKFGFIE